MVVLLLTETLDKVLDVNYFLPAGQFIEVIAEIEDLFLCNCSSFLSRRKFTMIIMLLKCILFSLLFGEVVNSWSLVIVVLITD